MTSTAVASPAALQRLMRESYPLSDQQWAAVSAPLEPGVVIAGAGSGKTTLMAARVVYLVATGQVRPDQVLGLTFTTKAAAELRARIRLALQTSGLLNSVIDDDGVEETLEPTVLTYNAYAVSLLTDHGLRIGHEPDTRVLTDASRYQLGARAVERHDAAVEQLSDHPATVIQNLLALDSAMSEHLVSAEEVLAYDLAQRSGFVAAREAEAAGKARKGHLEAAAKAMSAIDRRRELLGLVAGYRSLKKQLGLMDFSDQIELAARLVEESSEVAVAQRDAFKVILLDEYQDTSVAQAKMLSRLFSGATPAQGRGHPVTAVGDPNQAIYGWRGASVSNILRFAETFPPAAGETAAQAVYHLSVNRRSDRRILEVANRLAEPLLRDQSYVVPLEAKPNADEGVIGLRVFDTYLEELAWLAEAVAAAHRPDAGVKWSDIGVLTRDNSHAGLVFDALSGAGIPVEIVGLAGMLRLPEIAEVVAVLHLMHDLTANPQLLTVLNGPRWAIGPRDLALLGERAAQIAKTGQRRDFDNVTDQLKAVAEGLDPAEIACLSDALEDPGDLDYSPVARERFDRLAAELRSLRRAVGEPLLDVVRRVIDVTGVDIELASAVTPAAAARRDNLDLFVKAVAEFQSIDGAVTLPALLAYLTAEDDQGNGLDVATPTEADSVKLLTVHRAKGLEWHTVFLPGVCDGKFPSSQGRTLWTSSPAVLPVELRGDAQDLPKLEGFDKEALEAYRRSAKSHEQAEELRLGYVALTRAVHEMQLSAYSWGTRKTAHGPSPYLVEVAEALRAWGVPYTWVDKPEGTADNPVAEGTRALPWPSGSVGHEALLRREAARLLAAVDPDEPDDELDMVQAALVAQWDAELDRLVEEAQADRADEVAVPRPPAMSATTLMRLRDDPDGFARDLARPMPRPPTPAARFGTRFHAWIESRFDQRGLFDPDELPGRADEGIEDGADLQALIERFEAGPFADRVPTAVEPAFAVVLGGQVVRGRIDAVYAEPDGSFLVIDWKTNQSQSADPLQLAIYRLAWAELQGVPLDRVRAAFHYVRTSSTVEPDQLLDREQLEQLVAPADSAS